MSYIRPDRLLWHMDRIHQIRYNGRTMAPVNVEIDLTNRCSLGCEWCHFAYTHTKGPHANGQVDADEDRMGKQLAFSILDQLTAAGVRSVTWTGGGEPTLHPDFDTMLAKAYQLDMPQGVYTHGGHISVERAARMRAMCDWVYVSLDETGAEAYKRSKGVDRFAAAVAGVERLVKTNGKATVGLGFLLHAGNAHDIPNMVDLGHRLGVDYMQFRPTIRFTDEKPGLRAEDADWIPNAVASLRLYENDKRVIADLERFQQYRYWQDHGYTTCHWSALQTVITPSGRVWRCLNKRMHAGAMLGDLRNESFATVWSRAGSCAVDGDCRVMCRGHMSNLQLTELMTAPVHADFI